MVTRKSYARTAPEPKGDGITGFPFDAPRDGSWKLSLPCNKAEAETLAEDIPALAMLDPMPVLMTSEPDPDRPDAWLLDVHVETAPSAELIALIRDLVPSAAGIAPEIVHIEEQDWVTLSQAGLEPIHAGRFHVRTPTHPERPPAGAIPFVIDAGRAFGTGHHETTTGCLIMLDRLRASGLVFRDIADIGTGTGLLAFAARALWPTARVIASDIDPVSIDVSAENAAVNAVPIGRGPGQVELVVAPGLAHSRLKARAPSDLLIANILAGPLVELADDFAGAVVPGGSVLLAGLLSEQEPQVRAAYRRAGFRLAARLVNGDWSILWLRRRG